MLTLVEIQEANNFTTDKGNLHSYLEYYDTIFNSYQNRDINLLEIGVDKGGSLLLWNKYFTPDSNIYGMDVYLHHVQPALEQLSNIIVIHKNMYYLNDNFLRPIKFDIVIDDGSHTLIDQQKSYEVFKNKLTKGGIFVIEDLQPEAFEYFTEFCKTNPNCEVVDRRHINDRYDDVLFVYRNV